MPLSEVVAVATEALLAEAGGIVTHLIQDLLGQAQTRLAAGMAEVLMVEAHLIVGNSFPLY